MGQGPTVQPIIKCITAEQALPLRQQVLWPDKSIEDCRLDEDDKGKHFGVLVDETLVCVASVFYDNTGARLRKFATLPNYQGKGMGSLMLRHIIADLDRASVGCFWCDAREGALTFYQKFGMKAYGERFYKGNIPYRRMSLVL